MAFVAIINNILLCMINHIYRNSPVPIMHQEWTKVQLEDGTDCLIWLKIESDSEDFKYTCYLTDLNRIFKEEGDLQSFETRFSVLNQDIEVEAEDLKDIANDLRLKLPSEDCKKIGRRVDDNIELIFDWERDEFDLKWMFKLSTGTCEQFYDIVTKQLFLCLLKQQQDKDCLIEVIKRKDLEIEDYENCGARLSRSSLKTGKFKVEDHLKDHIEGPAPNMLDYMVETKMKELLKCSYVSDPSPEHNSSNMSNPSAQSDTKDKKRKYNKPNLAQLSQASKVNAKKKQRLDKF